MTCTDLRGIGAMATRFPNYLLERWVEKSCYMKADLSIHKFQYQKEKLPFSATLGISHSPFAAFVTRLAIHVRVILLRNAMSLSVSLFCAISTVEKVMRWKSANIRGAFDVFKILYILVFLTVSCTLPLTTLPKRTTRKSSPSPTIPLMLLQSRRCLHQASSKTSWTFWTLGTLVQSLDYNREP